MASINEHLNMDLREIIERKLNEGYNFTQIGRIINKDRTTISKEIRLHRFKKIPGNFNNSSNFCINRSTCKKFNCNDSSSCYVEFLCEKLKKPPYVCNGCIAKSGCRRIKYYYSYKISNNEYRNTLSETRQGVNLSKDEVYKINSLITPLLCEQDQSISQIYINHPDELFFSKTTLYNYINRGIFSVKNIDLPRKVKYRPRKDGLKQRTRIETAIRKNRTYADFMKYISEHPDSSIVEIDTVEGKKGGKVFLTLLIRKSKLMLIFLLENKRTIDVDMVFAYLKETLGIEIFKKVFEVILTDNGSEFFNPIGIEVDYYTGEVVSNVFYCDPCASWQKGSIEKNHEYIRYILPKGKSFNNLTQEEVNILASHINSVPRESLNNQTPFEASKLIIDKESLDKLNIFPVKPDEVNLSRKLLKRYANANN